MSDDAQLKRLERALADFAPRSIAFACRRITPGDEVHLRPAEATALASRSLPQRRASATARIAARALLSRHGLPGAAILPAPSGAPIWPPGLVGSLAHDATIAIAAIAPASACLALGIDIEVPGSLPDDVLALVTTPAERRRLDPDQLSGGRTLFCIKEAVYKALSPLTSRFLDFHDIEIDLVKGRAYVSESPPIEVRRILAPRVAALAFIAADGASASQ